MQFCTDFGACRRGMDSYLEQDIILLNPIQINKVPVLLPIAVLLRLQ